MKFSVEQETTGNGIPGKGSHPTNVRDGMKPVRPPNTAGNMRASSGSKGSGGGSSSAGPNGTTNGPGGSHIKGFGGGVPGTMVSNTGKSPRDQSNPMKR